MRIAVLDTETTGIDPATDRVVEIAAAFLSNEDAPEFRVAAHTQQLVNPGRDIPPIAKAVHHITEKDVAGMPLLVDAITGHPQLRTADVYAAHNMAFDWGFLEGVLPADKPRICTWRCAQHIWPDAPAYGNQVLRYWLHVEPPYMPANAGSAHRALYDALCTAGIVLHLIEGLHDSTGGYEQAVAELVRLSDPALPIVQKIVRFGKYRGKPWADMDAGFCRWVLDKTRDFDADTRFNAQRQLDALLNAHYARLAARAAARTNPAKPPVLTS